MGHDEDKNNFNGGANLVSPASTASGPNPAVSVNPSPSPMSSTNNPSPNPMIPVVPNPRAQFTSGNRLGMRQSRTFSAQEELNRISNDLNPNSTTPTAPVGDIILGSEKPKKNRKPLIFALVGVAIVAVIGVVAALALVNNPKNKTKIANSEISAKFNEFVDFYLGKNVDFQKHYSRSISYEVDKAIEKGDAEFFETAREKTETLVSSIKDDTAENLKKYIKQYEKIFNFTYNYGTSVIPTEESVIKKYNDSGKDATISYIKNSYAKISNLSYHDSNEDVAKEIDYYTTMVNFYDLYKINGCIRTDGSNNEQCLFARGLGKVATDLSNSIAQKNKKRSNLLKYISYSKEALWQINDELMRVE